MAIKLGGKVRDRVTGFEGVVVARTDWLYGCSRFGVQSSGMKDGVPLAAQWFDEQSLDALSTEPGGPSPTGVETG